MKQKFLADESVDFRIVKALRQEGREVAAIAEDHASISDEEVLRIANEIKAVLLTEDKDFGELTYRLQKSSHGIILLRLSGQHIDTRIALVKKVIEEYEEHLPHSYIVISIKKVRVREL
ncbi:MAG: DUF5615 family PIN-like protein [Bacteroidota bacterium]